MSLLVNPNSFAAIANLSVDTAFPSCVPAVFSMSSIGKSFPKWANAILSAVGPQLSVVV